MRELKMIIVPSEMETRVWARDARRNIMVRARLPTEPAHPLALPRLLEAIGSFVRVHAALVVDDARSSFATRLYPGWFGDFGGDHYTLHLADARTRVRAIHDFARGRS